MIFTITIPAEVEVPDAALPELMAAVRQKWGQEAGSPVYSEDLLNEAAARGLVELPDGWGCDGAEYNDDDIPTVPPPKPARRKRKKS